MKRSLSVSLFAVVAVLPLLASCSSFTPLDQTLLTDAEYGNGQYRDGVLIPVGMRTDTALTPKYPVYRDRR